MGSHLLLVDERAAGRIVERCRHEKGTSNIETRGRQMIIEVSFWIAVVAVSRKLGKMYARSCDVLYGSYVSQ
jgi:hypothetical protein